MGQRKQNKPLRLGGHYKRVDGHLVEFDPLKSNLPERCKLAIAEMATGQPHRIREEVTR